MPISQDLKNSSQQSVNLSEEQETLLLLLKEQGLSITQAIGVGLLTQSRMATLGMLVWVYDNPKASVSEIMEMAVEMSNRHPSEES